MGVSTIGAVGVSLPPPQALYPLIPGLPSAATNRGSLGPGGDFIIPPGTWLISPGQYSQVQALDPMSNTWFPYCAQILNEPIQVNSDGTNFRVYNPTGFPIGAIVNSSGSGYTSTPTVAAGTGGSTWLAIVGGAISAININTASSGVGYAVPPLVGIAAPPTPGVQATAVCAISGGLITGFTIINPGAGYTSAPAVIVAPQNTDTNFFPPSTTTTFTATKNALATAVVSYVGMVTAVLLTNEGANVLNAAPALTFSGGGGSGAAATAVMAFTVTGLTVTTAGSGYAFPGTGITTIGGSLLGTTSGTAAATNSVALGVNLLVPRQAQITATAGSGTGVQVGVIIDGGLFQTPPTPIAFPGPFAIGVGSAPQAAAAFGITVGGVNDTLFVTPI